MLVDIMNASAGVESDVIRFASDLIKIQSFTGDEEKVIDRVQKEMERLGYDEIIRDRTGNVIGAMGGGSTSILYDCHADTIPVVDADKWSRNPFSGDIADHKIFGRGSVDMKCSISAMIYAGYMAKKLGFLKNTAFYASTTIMEEDCEGVALRNVLENFRVKPNYVVICEPTDLKIAIGQRGRASIKIVAEGTPSHGSQPEKGVNPIYNMNPIIEKIEQLGQRFIAGEGKGGSIALTKIECTTDSINSVPGECRIYLDRRIGINETREDIVSEMDSLLSGSHADWEILKFHEKSYMGESISGEAFYPAWYVDPEHDFVKSSVETFRVLFGEAPEIFMWQFSTNGVVSMGELNIPTIGFGPGPISQAHQRNEYCFIETMTDALKFYALLPQYALTSGTSD